MTNVSDNNDSHKQYPCLYPNDKYPNQSLMETIDLKTAEGHIFRDLSTYKFLYFGNHMEASNWFYQQDKPYIHSVVNKYKLVRFNLELDMELDKLENINLDAKHVNKIEEQGQDLNLIKYLLAVEHIKSKVYDVLEEYWGVEMSDYLFMEATDNRKGKYSHRLYLKLAFASQHEYKHFIKLLKAEVRTDVFPMVDATKLMLRTPQSWKDDHQCVWSTPNMFVDSILSYTDNCDDLKEIAPAKATTEEYEISDAIMKKAVGIVLSHPSILGNFSFGKINNNMITLTRQQESYCECCKREHDSIDAYAYISKNGHIYLGCFREGKNIQIGSVVEQQYAGYAGKPIEAMPLKWGEIKRKLRKIEKAGNVDGLSKKEQAVLCDEQKQALVQLEKKAEDNNKFLLRQDFTFDDFKYIHGKTFANETVIKEYVKQAVVKICQGGNSFYISKSFWQNTRHYTELSNAPLTARADKISYSIVNTEFDKSRPVAADNLAEIKKDLGDVMMDYMKTNFYKTVDFLPYLKEEKYSNGEVFNLFEGFRFPYTEVKHEDCITNNVNIPNCPKIQCWIDHIINICCSGDRKLARTIIQWFAHIIQKPQEKAFCVLMYGKQGTGKSLVYEIFKSAIGDELAIQFTKLSDLTQTHNKIVRGRLLVNANEATNYPTEKDVNIMKQFITDKDLLINPKCCPLYYISNYARVLITTNCKFAMRLTPDDRRYCCLEVSKKQVGNEQYFDPLIKMINDKDTLKALFDYLANFDIHDFKTQRPPMTALKREMIGEQMPDIVEFMKDLCENDVLGIEFEEKTLEVVSKGTRMYIEYKQWCENNGVKSCKKQAFNRDLKEKFGLEGKRHRVDNVRYRGFKINREQMLIKFKELLKDNEFTFDIVGQEMDLNEMDF